MELTVNNANDLFAEGLWKIKIHGREENSRNGPVLRIPEPVLTRVKNPMERVLFFGERDANPIFHLLEAIWMLAGRRDVAFPQLFNSKIGQYSDDGEVFNAAYGYRLRHHFGQDQLCGVIEKLKKDPETRQAVLQLWDAADLNKNTLDRACNTQLVLDIVDGKLNMTTFNRSNDFWYGAAGANIVHFTIIMEFIANAVGVGMGEYRSFTTNLHLYTELYDAGKHLVIPPDPDMYDMYRGVVKPLSLAVSEDYGKFLDDCENFCLDPFGHPHYYHSFFQDVAYPMAMVSKVRKEKTGDGVKWAEMIYASDWKLATLGWIKRREDAKRG
jgi:thymidylate synthase